MDINFYKFEELNKTQIVNLIKRSEDDFSEIFDEVKEIIQNVKTNGDKAIINLSKKYDNVEIKIKNLKVTQNEFNKSFEKIDPEIIKVLEFCSENVRQFHLAQMPRKKWMKEMHPGVLAGEKIEPINTVAMYVPKGKGSFPSVAMMTAIPAVVAGVKNPFIITPSEIDGSVDNATLVAAEIAGIKNVYKCGGAQAIAAVAFGTKTIPKCDKVVGPGNLWVSAAKQLLSNTIDTGIPAGPSEAIILADETSNGKLVALDLLVEAEHGPDSSVYLVTNSLNVANSVIAEVPNLWKHMSKKRVSYSSLVLSGPRGGVILTKTIDEAISFVNQYAPEHLQIHSKNPEKYLDQIKNAGEILLGEFSPLSIANFSLGPNNVIPTNGHVKTRSPLSVRDFIKSISIGQISEIGFNVLSPYVYKFAKYEGFDAHANAVSELRSKAMESKK